MLFVMSGIHQAEAHGFRSQTSSGSCRSLSYGTQQLPEYDFPYSKKHSHLDPVSDNLFAARKPYKTGVIQVVIW